MQTGLALILLLFMNVSVAQVTDPVPVPLPEPVPENVNEAKLNSLGNITRFAFGSCNNQNDAQPLWDDMLQTKPDIFAWGGDIIYADWESNYDIKASWEKQKLHPGYSKVREQTAIIGTWDDHDYSYNDADGTNKDKEVNKQLFLDFLDVPKDSPRRLQEGVYTSYEFGDPEKRVKVIMLDNRYFKNLEPSAPMLGNKQWEWLEQEFKNSTAKVHFVMAGLSIFSPLLPYSEEWGEHPREVNRMLSLIQKYRPQGIVFLTGDKHFGAIFQRYGQLEMIASGMTHVVTSRVWWYLGRKFAATWFGLNYGLIDIEWDGPTPLITLGFRTVDHRDIHRQKYRWEGNAWKRLWNLSDSHQEDSLRP